MNTSIALLALVVVAPVAAAQTKTPRAFPPTHSAKPDADASAPLALPGALQRTSNPCAARKPLPPGAPRPETLAPTRPDVMIDEPGDGRVWVRGADYKASFGADGALIVPFLGSDAPVDHPVRMSVASARSGDHAIELAPRGTLRRDGRHVVIGRGGLDEVYDVTRTGVEQTFVIDALPSRAGVHLEITMESDLVARESGAGIELANERGGMRCGSTTVLDAGGARIEMPTRFASGRMLVDVPESFVRGARLPLRIDPTWTTFQIAASAPDQYYSDLAYDVTWGNWCVVYEEAYSLADHDVYAVMVYSNAIVPGLTTAIDYTTDSWHEPKVANNNLADNFLVVANVWDAGSGNPVTKGRIRDAGSVTMGAQTVLSGPESGNKIAADVGGDPLLFGPTYYLVVYQRNYAFNDTDVHARLVQSDGTPVGGTIFVDDSPVTLDGAPRISKSDGNGPSTTQEWNIVWQRTDYATNLNDVRGAQVHWDGTITSPSFLIDGEVADDTNPVASPPLERMTGPRPWMVAYERNLGAYHDVMGTVLEGPIVTSTGDVTTLEAVHVGEDHLGPEIETDGVVFGVAYRETFLNNAQDYDIYLSAFWYVDQRLGLSEGHSILDFSSQNSYLPRIATQNSGTYAFGGAFQLTWTTLSAAGNFDIDAGQYFAPSNGPDRAYCFGDGSGTACPCSAGSSDSGCPSSVNANGASLSGAGFHRAVVDTFVLTASGMPANASCLFFQGSSQANGGNGVTFGDGLRCVAGNVVRLAAKTAQGGVATYPEGGDASISTKGGIGATGGVRDYQAWYRNADPTFCSASTFNLTNGFEAVWLP